MNRLSTKRQRQIIAALIEGNSIRATSRMTGAAKGTVLKLLTDVGKACSEYQDYVERQNLTMKMDMRRLTNLTNTASKKVGNLEHAVALHFMYYNFCRKHQTLKVTPAMEAGATNRLWEIEDILKLLNSNQPITTHAKALVETRLKIYNT